jgi:23S rRNA G2445 N2-methylase RlmL
LSFSALDFSMDVFNTPSRIFVTCNRGLAPVIERELVGLNLSPLRAFHTGVGLRGSLRDCIRLNLNLRCASQVMYSLREFRCQNPEQLYDEVESIPWESILEPDGYFTVHGNVSHPTIRSGMFANVKVKDAIVDRMRRATGKRPDSGAELRGAVVYLFWRNDTAEIFLDTSGETLAKHGYRKHPGKAPMVEALAAATVLTSRWDDQMPFVNPMCGSGTIAIEAALIATRRAPGLLRTRFAFSHIKGYESNYHRQEREQLHHQVRLPENLRILASDISPDAIRIARMNAEQAGVAEHIEFSKCDFFDTFVPPAPGIVLLNPEYGERLGEEAELESTYSRIGDFFKQKCGGYWGYVFTGNLQLAKRIGLKTKRRIEFATAQLDCRLLEFELYAGSRRPSDASTN